jgi:hypothetical protein
MGKTYTTDELANLSDDEIMNMALPPQVAEEVVEEEQEEIGEDAGDNSADSDAADDDGDADGDDVDSGQEDDTSAEQDEDSGSAQGEEEQEQEEDGADVLSQPDDAPPPETTDKPEDKVEDDKAAKAEADKKPAKEELKKEDEKPAEKQEPIDYKAAYEKVMAPFRANGKEVKLENIDEVVRLMQMGAHYTKKMQALQPNLKILKMLENQNLLDAKKLSFLIDIEKKNPEAIKKLIKDAGIDPMDLDMEKDSGYKAGDYQVPDEELRFVEVLEEIASEAPGKELVATIHKTWDRASKDAIFKDPEVLRVLTTQRENGVYSQIVAEVERRKILGNITQNTPFLTAYYQVGKELDEQGKLRPMVPQRSAQGTVPVKEAQASATKEIPAQDQRRIVDQRAKPRHTGSTVTNGEKAKAASPATGMAPKKSGVDPEFNPLAMSDEDFLKNADLARRI